MVIKTIHPLSILSIINALCYSQFLIHHFLCDIIRINKALQFANCFFLFIDGFLNNI